MGILWRGDVSGYQIHLPVRKDRQIYLRSQKMILSSWALQEMLGICVVGFSQKERAIGPQKVVGVIQVGTLPALGSMASSFLDSVGQSILGCVGWAILGCGWVELGKCGSGSSSNLNFYF